MKTAQPKEIELQLSTNTELPARFGKQIKAAGGRYSDVRGRCSVRFVHLPLTPEGRALADLLITTYAGCWSSADKVTVIFRKIGEGYCRIPSHVLVQYVYRGAGETILSAISRFEKSLAKWAAENRTVALEMKVIEPNADERLQQAEEYVAMLNRLIADTQEQIRTCQREIEEYEAKLLDARAALAELKPVGV